MLHARRRFFATAGLTAAGLVWLTFSAFAHIAAGQTPAKQPVGTPGAKEADALFIVATVKLKALQFDGAEEDFHKLAELEPGGLRGLMGVAQVLLAQKKTDEAIRFLQAEAAKTPLRLDIHLALGDAAVRAGQFDLALAEFRTVLASADPALDDLYVPRGAVAATIVARDTDPVAESMNVLIGVDRTPRGPAGVHVRLAEVLHRKNDTAGAAKEWQTTSELLPKMPWPLANLGVELELTGKRAEAIKAYRESLAIAPNSMLVLNNLAFLIAETGGDLYEALRYARKASNLAPGLPDIIDTVGWVTLKQGYIDDAILTFRQVVEKSPGNVEFRKHLSMALAQRTTRSPGEDELYKALNSPPVAGDEEKILQLLKKSGKQVQ